jgi:hypothetical protein
MTKQEIDERMKLYKRAYLEGRITKHEWLGFVQALRSFVPREDNVGIN